MTWSAWMPQESRKCGYRKPDLPRDGIYRETRLPHQFACTSINSCYDAMLGTQVWTARGKPTLLCVVCLQPRTVKKLERAEDKERMMVRFDEEDPSGAPVSIRDRHGESAASAAE
jgi:hypothetical protein